MRRNILNVLCVIGAPLFESTLAPRRSIAFRNSAGTWSRAPGKQFGVLDRWRDRHTRPARWSDTLRIRPVRWRKWNRIRIDLARLVDPIVCLWTEISYIWHHDATLIKQNARGTAGDNRVNCNRIPRAAVYDIPPVPPGDSAGQKIALIATGLYSSAKFPERSCHRLGHVGFMWPPVRERVSVSYGWPGTVEFTKRQLANVTIVSNPGCQMNERKRKSCQISWIWKLA